MKKYTFEQAMAELDTLLRSMEDGALSLEETMKAYEEAVGLIKHCQEKLAQCDRKITVLKTTLDGVQEQQIEDPFISG